MPDESAAPAWRWPDALAVVVACWLVLPLGFVVVVSVGPWAPKNLPITAHVLSTLPFWVAAVGASWWFARSSSEGPSRALGLCFRPLDAPLGLVVGVGLQLLMPILYWPVFRMTGTTVDDLEEPARKVVESAQGAPGKALLVLFACIAAPVAEEVLYRGFMQRAVWPTQWVGLAVTTVVFAASHVQPLQFPGLVLFGLGAGLIVVRTGRVGPAIVAHMAFNTTAVVLVLESL